MDSLAGSRRYHPFGDAESRVGASRDRSTIRLIRRTPSTSHRRADIRIHRTASCRRQVRLDRATRPVSKYARGEPSPATRTSADSEGPKQYRILVASDVVEITRCHRGENGDRSRATEPGGWPRAALARWRQSDLGRECYSSAASTPRSTSSSISSGEYPCSARISRLCSPWRGAGRSTPTSQADSETGGDVSVSESYWG